jgi:UMP-CMP kinase
LTLAAAEKAKLGNAMAEAEVVLETVNRSLNSTLGEDDREDSGIADEMGESNIAVYEMGAANEIDEDFVEDCGGKEKKEGGVRVQVEDVLEEASHGMSDENNAAAGVVVVDAQTPEKQVGAANEIDEDFVEEDGGGKEKKEGGARVQVKDVLEEASHGMSDENNAAVGVVVVDAQTPEKQADSRIDASGLHGQHTAEKRRKPQVVFVLGGPGVGKGTQCANIVKKYGWCHLSAGDLLRAERATASAEADLINSCIKEGKLVPVEITVKLLLAAMQQSKTQSFLLDGFPRSIDNYEGWCAVVGDQADVACCLFYECGLGELERRLLDRGKTSGRDDDNIQSIKKRFITFMNETSPIVEVCVFVCVCLRARACTCLLWHVGARFDASEMRASTHASTHTRAHSRATCSLSLIRALSLSYVLSLSDFRASWKAADYQR